MKKEQEGFSMPLSNPSYGPPPYKMLPSTKVLNVYFEANRKAMEFEVPEPLELAPDTIAQVWIGDMVQPPHSYAYYHEGVVAILVQYKGKVGWFTPYGWTHTDEPLLQGREVFGIHQVLCEDTPLQFKGHQIQGVIKRYSETLMRISFNITSPPPEFREKKDEKTFLKYTNIPFYMLRKIPSPEKNGKAIRQLILSPYSEVTIEEIWTGDAIVEFGKSAYCPNLYKLEPTRYLYASYSRPSWILGYGKILWEDK
jgi:acetoacetate decarboxylase